MHISCRALPTSAPQMQCTYGYMGSLCGRCIQGYGSKGNGECLKCADRYINIAYYIFSVRCDFGTHAPSSKRCYVRALAVHCGDMKSTVQMCELTLCGSPAAAF